MRKFTFGNPLRRVVDGGDGRPVGGTEPEIAEDAEDREKGAVGKLGPDVDEEEDAEEGRDEDAAGGRREGPVLRDLVWRARWGVAAIHSS